MDASAFFCLQQGLFCELHSHSMFPTLRTSGSPAACAMRAAVSKAKPRVPARWLSLDSKPYPPCKARYRKISSDGYGVARYPRDIAPVFSSNGIP